VPEKKADLSRRVHAGRHGLGQLTLVEHALCPLEGSRPAAEAPYCCAYDYFDSHHRRKTARARIDAPLGLSASDEFFLWGLLALTLAQREATFDFHATPHYCLKQLGCLSRESKGGKNYAQFRAAIGRLAAVRYQNDRFYDPIRKEHRAVSFGFFSYSLPLAADSSRAWRIVWDPLFFEFCRPLGGHVAFDLATYRGLDTASRRLFLLLKKVFWRRRVSPVFDVRHLAIDVLGYAPTLPTGKLKARLQRSATRLLQRQIIGLGPRLLRVEGLFEKRRKGVYTVRFHRGTYFGQTRRAAGQARIQDSPHYEPLAAIGLDDASIGRVLARFQPETIRLWADITLAALERKGKGFFRRSPAAYFMNNLQVAAQGRRTPPDWYHQLGKQERQRQSPTGNTPPAQVAETSAENKTLSAAERPLFESVMAEMLAQFRAAGQEEPDACRNAHRFARQHLQNLRAREAARPATSIGKLLGQ